MFSRQTFTRRFGEPTGFIFKGQVWDTHLPDATPDKKRCAVCNRRIRLLFILMRRQDSDQAANPDAGKMGIGRCCFHYFRKWHAPLAGALVRSLRSQMDRAAAIKRDEKRFREWAAVTVRIKMWRSLRRQGIIRLRRLRQAGAVAPVGGVADLAQALARQPAKHTARWYDKEIKELRQKIAGLSI
jgi:hypothetical protein